MSKDAITRRDLDDPRTSEALREPDNIRRRPIKLPPMVPIKSDAIGSVFDEPELTIVEPWDFDLAQLERDGLIPQEGESVLADVKSAA